MEKFDAVFVGLTILDISGRPVSRMPDGGGVEFIDEIRLNPAGTAAGALINAAKLGVKCATVACVGTDEKGTFIIDAYKKLQIDCTMMKQTPDAGTSATILPIRPNGERPALHCRGASDHLFIDEAEFNAVCDARFLHHGGTGLLNAMDAQAHPGAENQSAKLLKYAKDKGLTTSFDLIAPNDNTMDLLKPLLPHVDYFMPSMEEAEFLSGYKKPEDIAKYFLELGAGACIFKWGDQGSYIATHDSAFRIPAYQVAVSDTTGCGDSYCGGFIAGLSMGWDLEKACRLGTATSGLVATGLGSDAGVKNLDETLIFLKTAKLLE
ncbi:MAG: sugar kinase [Deltaproteobacteria bacterium]|jgi:sugar/nucleoside kinase (ribokinase family)|nr:sugar kinase [Deltaproteobacteria bacterium]MBT4643820.1 sugar kinase [Deltaproteobacteria bacterium]